MDNDSDRTTQRCFFGVSTILQALICRSDFRLQLQRNLKACVCRNILTSVNHAFIAVENTEKEIVRLNLAVITVTYAAAALKTR
jgi:hypothetical protein